MEHKQEPGGLTEGQGGGIVVAIIGVSGFLIGLIGLFVM